MYCSATPNADHTQCPSSVECVVVTLPGEKDSMEAYVTDKAPELAPRDPFAGRWIGFRN